MADNLSADVVSATQTTGKLSTPSAFAPKVKSLMGHDQGSDAADRAASTTLEQTLLSKNPETTKDVIDSLMKQGKEGIIEATFVRTLAAGGTMEFKGQALQYFLSATQDQLLSMPCTDAKKVQEYVNDLQKRISDKALAEHFAIHKIGPGHHDQAVAIAMTVLGVTKVDAPTARNMDSFLKAKALTVVNSLAENQDPATKNLREQQIRVIQTEYRLAAPVVATALTTVKKLPQYNNEQSAAVSNAAAGAVDCIDINRPSDVKEDVVKRLKEVNLTGQKHVDEAAKQAITLVMSAPVPSVVKDDKDALQVVQLQDKAIKVSHALAYEVPESGRRIVSPDVQTHLQASLDKGSAALVAYGQNNLNERTANRKQIDNLIRVAGAKIDTEEGMNALVTALHEAHIPEELLHDQLRSYALREFKAIAIAGAMHKDSADKIATRYQRMNGLLEALDMNLSGDSFFQSQSQLCEATISRAHDRELAMGTTAKRNAA